MTTKNLFLFPGTAAAFAAAQRMEASAVTNQGLVVEWSSHPVYLHFLAAVVESGTMTNCKSFDVTVLRDKSGRVLRICGSISAAFEAYVLSQV